MYPTVSSFTNSSVSTLASSSPSPSACDISCLVFAGGVPLTWPATIPTTLITVVETVFIQNGTSITSAQTLPQAESYTTLSNDPLYIPSLYVNGTVTGNGVEFIYPTQYIGIQLFQAVTNCAVPGCTALSNCDPESIDNNVAQTTFPFRGITTAGYYYINGGLNFGGTFDEEEVQPFLSLLGLPANCPVVLQGPPYALEPVAQLTVTQTLISSYPGQTLSPKASPSSIASSTSGTPYYLTPAVSTSTIIQAPTSHPSPPNQGGPVTISTSLITTPSASPKVLSLGPSAVSSISTVSPASAVSSAGVGPSEASVPITASALPTIVYAGSTFIADSASQYRVDSQTLVPGGSPITVQGTEISLASAASDLVIGSETQALSAAVPAMVSQPPRITVMGSTITPNPNTNGGYNIGTQTLLPGAPAITVSGTAVSLAPSASAVIINGVTKILSAVAVPQPTEPPLIIGSLTITANSASQYLIATLLPGGPGIKIDGTLVSLAPSASDVVINGVTETLPAAAVPQPTEPPLLIGSSTITANSAGQYLIGTATLVPGGPAITVSGTVISLAPSDSAIIINGHTYPATQPTPASNPSPLATINGQVLSINSAGVYQIGSETLTPGGPGITIDGTPISLAPSGADVVIGTSTETLAPMTTGGLGGVIFSGLGGGLPGLTTGSLPVATTGRTIRFSSGAVSSRASWRGCVLLGILGVLAALLRS
ncbi:hypothetical protein MMC11_000847 [Xylographa trunciseda]|nr:hypothetical protein [Xylographa trunciseda]